MEIDIIKDEISKNNLKLNKDEIIQTYEMKILMSTIEIEAWKKIITYLKSDNEVNLKWRDEIRNCLYEREKLMTSSNISACIAIKNKISVSKNLKAKVSSTLSLMFNEGEIGRHSIKGNKDHLYGGKNHFSQDEKGKYTELKK